jgi:hypothetical protein
MRAAIVGTRLRFDAFAIFGRHLSVRLGTEISDPDLERQKPIAGFSFDRCDPLLRFYPWLQEGLGEGLRRGLLLERAGIKGKLDSNGGHDDAVGCCLGNYIRQRG